MTKGEHIDYWIRMSDRDWATVQVLFDGGRYLHSLFFAHLSLEKFLKALWVRDNIEDTPPRIHNLVTLYDQLALELSSDETELLQSVNQYNLAGRYQDYLDKVYKRVDKQYANEKIKECIALRRLLRQELQ